MKYSAERTFLFHI